MCFEGVFFVVFLFFVIFIFVFYFFALLSVYFCGYVMNFLWEKDQKSGIL